MSRSAPLSTRAVDALVIRGLSLPRIAGTLRTSVSVVRDLYAGVEPEPMVRVTLQCAAAVVTALIPFDENAEPVEMFACEPMTTAEARRAVAAIRAAGFKWADIAERIGARHYQVVQSWATGRCPPAPEFADRLRAFARAVRAGAEEAAKDCDSRYGLMSRIGMSV